MSNGNGTNTALVPTDTVMGSMAQRYQMKPADLLDVLKKTCIRGEGVSDAQVKAFCLVANHYDLNPFLREIYAFPQGGGIVPIVSVDGWSKIANRTGAFDGCEFEFAERGDGNPISCTCTIHVKGREHPVRVTEYMTECQRPTPTWKQMPHRMLRHKAFIQAVRVAFGLGGIYDEDEGEDIRRNEANSGTAKLAALNAAVKAPQPHPTDPENTIDPSTSNEPIQGEMDVHTEESPA
jgi:phage recombination protein Bet